MSDTRSGDDEALPWLEGVEDEDEPPAVSARKMLAALALVLLGVAVVAGALFWLGRQDTGTGPPQLIRGLLPHRTPRYRVPHAPLLLAIPQQSCPTISRSDMKMQVFGVLVFSEIGDNTAPAVLRFNLCSHLAHDVQQPMNNGYVVTPQIR